MRVKYTEDHEWIKLEEGGAVVGISTYAAKALGDVVFVELPEIGRVMSKGDEAVIVESVKAASEVYAPVSGKVTEVNTVLEDAPGTVNLSAGADGWFIKMSLSDISELDDLMDEDAYKRYCEGL